MKKCLLIFILLLLTNSFIFSGEKQENWKPAKFAIVFPLSLSFGDNSSYFSFSIGSGMRIKTFADLYIHPSISYAMIMETHTVTKELFGQPWTTEETEMHSKATFRMAFEYTVYKYSVLRRKDPYIYRRHHNPLVMVDGDIGPVIGFSYTDGFNIDVGINWREGWMTSSYGIQYNLEKNAFGFIMTYGFCF